ncbi:hypothetical protein WISP_02283 [Willisornis vidua]|uniref:Uncharacterized protein n=1 Tax=Willisornis vidua TaxID=1566151 RepID=A0ABQ9DUR9_9PASS|nr:hypothetical protein WISP_02283 [Willisornis vidua]
MSRGNLERRLRKIFKWQLCKSECLRSEPDDPQLEKVDLTNRDMVFPGQTWRRHGMVGWETYLCPSSLIQELKESGRRLLRIHDTVIPIHKVIHELETQGVVSKTHSPFNSPLLPVRKSDRKWRLTVDDYGFNEATPPLSATVPQLLELQYELESKAAKWYATTDIVNAFFSIALATECRLQFSFTWRGM